MFDRAVAEIANLAKLSTRTLYSHLGDRKAAREKEGRMTMPDDHVEEVCELPNGSMLFRERNEVGGFRYWSDEVGGGVCVWDTCLTASSTLLAAIAEEERRVRQERWEAERAGR